MKTFKLLLTSLMMFAFLVSACADNKQKSKGNNEITYSVNIHCENCKKKIDNVIPFEKGVVDMKTTLENHEVWVKYDPAKTNKDKIKKAIEKMGYTVEEVEPKAVEE